MTTDNPIPFNAAMMRATDLISAADELKLIFDIAARGDADYLLAHVADVRRVMTNRMSR